MIMSKKLGLTLVAAAVITVYGCGKQEEPKKAEPPKAAATPPAEEVVTVKMGHAGPLTGGIAHLGKDDENGARLAVDEATAKGMKIGGKKVKFELISEDDQADPKLGPTIAQKFVDAKVAGVAGHLNSGVTIPASAVYNQAGIPMISGSATNPKLTEQGFKNVFRTVGRDDQQGPAIAQYLANMKVKKVAIADDATAYGEGLANEVEKALTRLGEVEGRRGQRDREVVALTDAATQLGEHALLFGRFDALSHGHQRHVPGDADDGADQGHIVPVAVQFRHEGTIDLEHVEAEVLEVGQARVARSEIVQGQDYPQISEAAQGLADLAVQIQEDTFGHFNFKAARGQPMARKGFPDMGDEILTT